MRRSVLRDAVLVLGLVGAVGLTTYRTFAQIDLTTVAGMWLFDEGTGDLAKDASGNGLDGEIQGDPKWVDGKFGLALQFDGKTAFVTVPPHRNPTEAITVTAWVKSLTPTWNQPGFVVEKRNAFILHPNQGTTQVAFPICNGGCWNRPFNWDTGSVGPVDITEWHMYTGTFDSTTGEWILYIDGKPESRLDLTKAPLQEDAGPLHIGWDECCGGNRFGNAIIDEVAVFSKALEPDEIQSIMERGLFQSVLAVDPNGKLATRWGALKQEQ